MVEVTVKKVKQDNFFGGLRRERFPCFGDVGGEEREAKRGRDVEEGVEDGGRRQVEGVQDFKTTLLQPPVEGRIRRSSYLLPLPRLLLSLSSFHCVGCNFGFPEGEKSVKELGGEREEEGL